MALFLLGALIALLFIGSLTFIAFSPINEAAFDWALTYGSGYDTNTLTFLQSTWTIFPFLFLVGVAVYLLLQAQKR